MIKDIGCRNGYLDKTVSYGAIKFEGELKKNFYRSLYLKDKKI